MCCPSHQQETLRYQAPHYKDPDEKRLSAKYNFAVGHLPAHEAESGKSPRESDQPLKLNQRDQEQRGAMEKMEERMDKMEKRLGERMDDIELR